MEAHSSIAESIDPVKESVVRLRRLQVDADGPSVRDLERLTEKRRPSQLSSLVVGKADHLDHRFCTRAVFLTDPGHWRACSPQASDLASRRLSATESMRMVIDGACRGVSDGSEGDGVRTFSEVTASKGIVVT